MRLVLGGFLALAGAWSADGAGAESVKPSAMVVLVCGLLATVAGCLVLWKYCRCPYCGAWTGLKWPWWDWQGERHCSKCGEKLEYNDT